MPNSNIKGRYRKQKLGNTQQSQPYDLSMIAAILVMIQILIIYAIF
jgi:hypothetical protein